MNVVEGVRSAPLSRRAERDREQDRASTTQNRKEEAAVILAPQLRQVAAPEGHGFPPHERPAPLKPQLDQAPGGVDPGGRRDHEQRVVRGRTGFAIPKEHPSNLAFLDRTRRRLGWRTEVLRREAKRYAGV